MRGRVLLADDAAFMRAWLREILEPEGLLVVAEAESGADATRAFAAHRPDLVLLDVSMPPTSGLEALRAIRTLDPSARVVMRSARGQEAAVMEALRAGALDYVVKPLHPATVLSTVRAALEKAL